LMEELTLRPHRRQQDKGHEGYSDSDAQIEDLSHSPQATPERIVSKQSKNCRELAASLAMSGPPDRVPGSRVDARRFGNSI
jgi:hypothetical protein